MSIVSSEWLNKNIDKVKIIDCSWHMPSENRNPLEEYKNDQWTKEHTVALEKSINDQMAMIKLMQLK